MLMLLLTRCWSLMTSMTRVGSMRESFIGTLRLPSCTWGKLHSHDRELCHYQSWRITGPENRYLAVTRLTATSKFSMAFDWMVHRTSQLRKVCLAFTPHSCCNMVSWCFLFVTEWFAIIFHLSWDQIVLSFYTQHVHVWWLTDCPIQSCHRWRSFTVLCPWYLRGAFKALRLSELFTLFSLWEQVQDLKWSSGSKVSFNYSAK